MRRNTTPNSPLVIGVGGGGCHLETGSIPFRMIKSTLEDSSIPYEQVHGCDDLYGSNPRVLLPSEQYEQIDTIVSASPETQPILLLGHCLGGCAVVNYLRDNPDRSRVSGAIFAPATQPDKVVMNPQSQARRRANGTMMRLNVLAGTTRDYRRRVAYSVDAALPAAYVSEAHETHLMMSDMEQLVRLGRLSLWAAENDWNQTSPQDIATLRQRCGNQHADRLRIVPDAAHGLYPATTPTTDPVEQIAVQKQTIEALIATEVGAAIGTAAQ